MTEDFKKHRRLEDNHVIKTTIDKEWLGYGLKPLADGNPIKPKEVRARRGAAMKGENGVKRWKVWDVPESDEWMEHHGTMLVKLLQLDQARFTGSSFRSLFDRTYQLMMTCRFDERDNRKELAWGEQGFDGPASEELVVVSNAVHCARAFTDMEFDDIHPCHTMDGWGGQVSDVTLRKTCEWILETEMLRVPPPELRARWLVEGFVRWGRIPNYGDIPAYTDRLCDDMCTNIGGGIEEFVAAFCKRHLSKKKFDVLRQTIESEQEEFLAHGNRPPSWRKKLL